MSNKPCPSFVLFIQTSRSTVAGFGRSRNIRVIIILSILAVAFLDDPTSNWISIHKLIFLIRPCSWSSIFSWWAWSCSGSSVYQEVKPTSKERTLGATGGRKFRSIKFVLIIRHGIQILYATGSACALPSLVAEYCYARFCYHPRYRLNDSCDYNKSVYLFYRY